ncbi:hypothetical protein [Prolixibacter sp. SD074]|jgi:hypothetical protein|uniref:hypothetical protein n=1 Tax=Prolixibacter sp. SD074 TaxID=2652391 RepID=UPI00126E1908|nr:hypothetical protein [Prolixibacter sp. SD074]GET28126.1 hypothetical protein SD074_03280 [Prolixibacter sp. SD074]
MKNPVASIIIFVIIGLVLGYLIFGRISGEYVDISTIFKSSSGAIESFGRKLAGISKIRQNILITGGVGGIVGYVVYLIRKR